MDSDDSEIEEDLLRPAFQIENPSNYDPEDMPTDGHEYLLRVRHEAKKCPKVIVAAVDRDKFKSNQTFTVPERENYSIPTSFIPSEDWQLKQIEDFEKLRLQVESLKKQNAVTPADHNIPIDKDIDKWYSYIYGNKGSLPYLSTMIKINHFNLCRVLNYFDEWLEDGQVTFDELTSLWIYSAFACVETPLEPDTCSTIRNIASHAIKARSLMREKDKDDGILKRFNLLICIAGRYFRQADLADL